VLVLGHAADTLSLSAEEQSALWLFACLPGLVGSLEDSRHLLTDPIERAANGRLGRMGRLKLGYELRGAPDVRVDGDAVIAPQYGWKVGVRRECHGVVRQARQGLCDLLYQGVPFSCDVLVGHGLSFPLAPGG